MCAKRKPVQCVGGGICSIVSNQGTIKPRITNCLFTQNISTYGGASYSRGANGGHIKISAINSVFYQNEANIGGAIYQNETTDTSEVSCKISNSIFTKNAAGFSPLFHLTGPSSIYTYYSLFDDPDCLSLVQGSGNNESNCVAGNIFGQNPLFVNPAEENFRVQTTSPAVDAGSNAHLPQDLLYDFEGNERVSNGIVDMGIYETNNTTSDSDGDRVRDIHDNCPLVNNPNQTDQDQDGTGAACDCDDSPSTGVLCSTGCRLFYLDSDGDNYGNPNVSVLACIAPENYVSNNQDFEDNDSALYPDAPELCDGKDNNNNGQIDEGTDDDRDGVCNEYDIWPGGDDNLDLNNNNIPDYCEITLQCPTDITVSTTNSQSSAMVSWEEPSANTNCEGGNSDGNTCKGQAISGFSFMGTFNGSDYYLSNKGALWTRARDICTDNGGHLVEINTEEENTFIKNNIGNKIVHIGLTDQDEEGSFKWTNGAPLSFNNLVTNSAHEDFALMYFWDGTWGAAGNFIKYYVLEIPCGGGKTSGLNIDQTSGPANGGAFPLGRTTVTYTATDACGGSISCSFEVIVEAASSVLSLNCPTDITISADQGAAEAIVTWVEPVPVSNCLVGGLQTINSHSSGTAFPIGKTVVHYEASDECGNRTTCSFTVTVLENQSNNLSLICPVDINREVPYGSEGAIITWEDPLVDTNCDNSPESNTTECSGLAIEGFTFAGTFNGSDYYLSDDTAPWLTAKANCEKAGGTLAGIESQEENEFVKSISGTNILHIGMTDEDKEGDPVWLNGETVNYTNFTSYNRNNINKNYTVFYFWDGSWAWSDNSSWKKYLLEIKCGSSTALPEVSQISGPPSGSSFPLGSTRITYQATDECGNLTTCSFSINLTEAEDNCYPDQNGGQISGNEIICDPFDPQTITSSSLPTGGTGTLEYVWLQSETGCPTDFNQAIPNSNSPSYNPPLIHTTTYYVRWSRRGPCSDWMPSNCITKTVDECGQSANYCRLSAEQPWQEWISNVQLSDLNHSSGKSLGYSDNTNLWANLIAGQSYSLSIEISFSYNQWDENLYAWIDFNQDNDFNDPGELVLEKISSSRGNGGPTHAPITKEITIPAQTPSGVTRLRVALKREAGISPCDSPGNEYIHGEVEDYTVMISTPASSRSTPILAFEAYTKNEKSILEWYSNTAREEQYYQIEHSTNNFDFKRIDSITLDNMIDQEAFFRYEHQTPATGNNYYRIKQIFRDNRNVDSPIRKVVYGNKKSNFQFFPNPAKEWIQVDLSGFEGQSGSLTITNTLGQSLQKTTVREISTEPIRMNLNRLENGWYILSFKANGVPARSELFLIEKEN